MDRPILLNARAASRPELGGVERWAREMVRRLPALRPGAYALARPPAAFVHRAGQVWEQLVLPARAAGARTPLLFSPANLAPVLWPRNVVVIHDAAALRHPEFYSPAYVRWQRTILPAIARRALHVITVSEFSRGEIVALLGAPPERVSVIPGGVDERFAPTVDPEPARRALGLERPYVLTVASRTARKNLAALALAAQRLGERGIDLVAAGGGRPQLRAEEAVPGLRALGHVAEKQLPGLYAGARAFVLPSRYEGFGLTCLEAMAAGTPVLAADRAALPEVCGSAAVLVDPDDPEELAGALERVLDDAPLRERLVPAGLARAGELTWARAARRVDALLSGSA